MIKKPQNIADNLDQLRPPIMRSSGSTPSERYLARVAERTFLNLWSYPNLYRAQKLAGAGDGKELCDLLIVCDPHIIVFSEKQIGWPDKPVDVAWPRWFRKAVLAAASQLKGAERWITEFPDRVFLDRACEKPFPLSFPSVERRRMHRVVVARGATEMCRQYFEGGLGTLVLKPELKGMDHCDATAAAFLPFAVGDIDPEGGFVHVFDEVALDVVMGELDTISDFTQYLDKRAEFLRSGRLAQAHGEEDLLAYYAIRINDEGDHDFAPPDGTTWEEIAPLIIGAGNYSRYISNDQYKAKKAADKISYAWDRLIETFTNHMLNGTSIVLPGHSYSLTKSEIAVRHMALQNRFLRRNHSEAILSALEIGRSEQVFFRAMLASPTSRQNETGFFFMTLKYLDWMDAQGGYEKYRLFRTFYLETYAKSLLMKFSHLEQVIGIAMEPPGQGRGSSEDIIYAEQTSWNQEDRDQVRNDCEQLGIMTSLKETRHHGAEYPEVQRQPRSTSPYGNRKERRAKAARKRKTRKS